MSGQEKIFENQIKSYIKKIGGWCYKTMGNAYTVNGVPDVLACINGHFIAIEVKSENGKPSPLQLAKISEIRNAGGIAHVVYPSGWMKLKAILDGIKRDEFNLYESVQLK